jgi:hypothetical protein
MTGRRAILGICMLCVLAISAVAAQSAMAVTGTTAFTCVKDAAGTLKGEHCVTGGSGENYKHVEIPQDDTTEIQLTNAKTKNETKESTSIIFKVTTAGVPLELRATGVSGTGTLTNKKDAATEEHYVTGTAEFKYTGVTVVSPAGKGCEVFTDPGVGLPHGTAGEIDWHADFTTQGVGDSIKFTPAASTGVGAPFATFNITCSITKVPALEGTWEVTGSETCKPTAPTGATIHCIHAEMTTANTLKAKGAKAGLEGAITISGRANSGEAYKPLSFTTVTTC